ncbi:VOC family protein [Ornithinibacillus halotolerans]|uniref:VOC domain-containing protein n=1 Tax=Ornithinibacillus halotolerans TaxID=1274357 RepID=A0A916W9Q8_9BACI|nr:VOC family protein [Ornithinibacillus halotolerans]GGA80561.1 hypothetical protein GCM10008025_24970 [Ornithinibacillus halotolerans]
MEIQLLTLQSNNLSKMRTFYIETLGFPLIAEDDHSFRIGVGSSQLEFTSKNVKRNPYYHFAINIPSNLFQEAKAWLKGKVNLLLEDDDDEAYFSFWQAYACYFEDPSGNIVELITRTKENPKSNSPFSIRHMLNISEIGLVVKDAPKVGELLKEFNIYERDNDPITNSSLSFMQDQKNGVFILLTGTGRRWLFSEKKSEIFSMKITLDTNITLGVDDELEFFVANSNYKVT